MAESSSLTIDNMGKFEFIISGKQFFLEYLVAKDPISNTEHSFGKLHRIFKSGGDLSSDRGGQKFLTRIIKLDRIKPYKL
jgi:hypothetical protein